MLKTFRAFGTAGALLCLTATVAAAQNNSDNIVTGINGASNSGNFSPGNAGNRAGGFPSVTVASVASVERTLARGSAADQTLGLILAGGSTTAFGNALTAAGANPVQVAALMLSLHTLGSNPSPEALRSAIRDFNDLIRTAPVGFINNPPAEIMSVRFALVTMENARA